MALQQMNKCTFACRTGIFYFENLRFPIFYKCAIANEIIVNTQSEMQIGAPAFREKIVT
jgi:hypothetical protein